MCETLNDVEFIEDPDEPDKTKIRLLTKKEAKALAAKLAKANSGQTEDVTVYKRDDVVDNSSIFGVADELLDLKDKNLLKAIAKYKQPSERMGLGLHVKMVSFVLRMLKEGAMQVVGHLPLIGQFVPTSSKDLAKINSREEALKYFQHHKGQIVQKKTVGQVLKFIFRRLVCGAIVADSLVPIMLLVGVITVAIAVITLIVAGIAVVAIG